jgi:ubiquinone/menaquinone biosynthesis C-methylase UbiE
MEELWPRFLEPSGRPGPDYWVYFAERLARLATIPEGATILDLGTFDGNVLFRAMERMGAQGYGVGIDIDYDGFNDGVGEVEQRGCSEKVTFLQMDANALGFPPEVFDTVLANFVGWDHCFDFDRMEFTSSDKIMSEIMRVLKPGGQVGIGAWVKQSDIDWIVGEFKKYLPEYEKASGISISCYAKENPEGQRIILQSGGLETDEKSGL